MGKGVALHKINADTPLYMVEFKSSRTDFFYLSDLSLKLRKGDYVIVEADRGRDLGKIVTDILTHEQLLHLDQQSILEDNSEYDKETDDDTNNKKKSSEISVKEIYRQAAKEEIKALISKEQDEQKALSLCLQKIKDKKLPMVIADAEYQW